MNRPNDVGSQKHAEDNSGQQQASQTRSPPVSPNQRASRRPFFVFSKNQRRRQSPYKQRTATIDPINVWEEIIS